jgi:diacylglycerol kinase family enzyme
MDHVVVIANPVASQFTGGSHRDVMAQLTKTHSVEAVWPGSASEATTAAVDAASSGAAVIVAMGGDGMVHHVSQGLVGSKSALGIIPAGTTNVVARLLQIPSRPVKAARLIGSAEGATSIGVARMTLLRGTTETTHFAVFACGFGLDAEVVIKADADPYRKYRFGSIHYASTAIGVGVKSFPSKRNHLTVTAGQREFAATTALIQFRDVYSYFGKVPLRLSRERPAPLTVLVMDRLRRHRIPQIAVDAIAGRDLDSVNGIEVWPNVEVVEVAADPPVAAQADGESLGMVDQATVDWLPDSLNVIEATGHKFNPPGESSPEGMES